MSVLAMTVIHAKDHPNADSLRVYELVAPGVPELQVVANLERLYTPGDVVAVARIGAVLEDGTTIRKSRLRGVDSFGMALGPVDAAPGDDLSARYCQPAARSAAPGLPAEVALAKWASIEQLHAVRFALQQRLELGGEPPPRLTYRAKVKVDGTNGAIHALPAHDGRGGRFAAQSRTRLLAPDDDNYGFAAWAHGAAAELCAGLHARIGRAVVYGEWCGRGIQKRTAISRVERNVFAVFAVQLGDPARESTRLVVEPGRLRAMLPEHPDVFVLPWHGDAVELDFADPERLRAAAVRIDAMVAEVEATDPWVAEVFGLRGVGEGVVLYPVEGVAFDPEGGTDRDRYVDLMFKAKGEKHRVNRQKRAAQIDPEVARSVEEFVALVVTPARLEQGLEQVLGGRMDTRRMTELLQWVGQDVRKESAPELAAAGLEWKQVAKAVGQAAQRWYRGRAER
jgi:tRNA-binding EMAP/Myf-like protein